MKGIIIAGGLGTRLRPLTRRRPKPLVPLVNRPFLEYQVALLKAHGIDDIVFATNYMAEQIEAHFGDGSRFGVRMRYALEETPLGTGGAIRNAADLFPGHPVAVFNGDILTDFDLSAALAFHREKRAVATITLAEALRPNPFGVLILNEVGRVLEWREPSDAAKKALAAKRPTVDVTGTDLINAGFYVLEPECVACIPSGTPSSIERDIYPALLREEAAIYGFVPRGFWMDLGRPEQWMQATQAILNGVVQTLVPGQPIGQRVKLAPSAHLGGAVVLGDDCEVGAEAVLENCVLMNGVRIGARARLCNVIVDANAILEEGVCIEARGDDAFVSVIAADSRLGSDTRL